MTAYTVDLDGLCDLATRLEAFARHLLNVRDEVDTRLAGLRVDWQGVAADEQQRAHLLWSSGTAELTSALADLHTATDTARANYEAAIDASRRTWG